VKPQVANDSDRLSAAVEADGKYVGRGCIILKQRSSIPVKVARHKSSELSDVKSLFLLAFFVTMGSLTSAIVIGMFGGGFDNILAALAIAEVISLIWWSMTLLPFVLVTQFWIIYLLFRLITERSSRDPKIGVGLADEWLDGPY
jgi:hypothetical protein